MVNCYCYILVNFGSMMCAASHGVTVRGMFWMLTIFRGVTGFGIGAEYPSSSVTASEAANESVKKRSCFCFGNKFTIIFWWSICFKYILNC